jgi:hypothetical protein
MASGHASGGGAALRIEGIGHVSFCGPRLSEPGRWGPEAIRAVIEIGSGSGTVSVAESASRDPHEGQMPTVE